MIALLTCHSHAFEDTRRIGGCANRTRSTQTVVLAVSFITDTAETMTSHNTLETFTLGCAYHVHKLAFLEHVHRKDLAVFLFMTFLKTGEFEDILLRSSTGFGKVATHRFVRTALFLLAKSKLDGIITIFFFCSNLCHHTRTSFNHSARNLFSVGIKKTGHSDFLSN